MGYLETQFLRGLFFLVRLCGERGELVGKHCKHSKCTLPGVDLASPSRPLLVKNFKKSPRLYCTGISRVESFPG